MQLEPMAGTLKGVVEADECYIGARPRRKNNSPKMGKRGAGKAKEPVAVLVERDAAAYRRFDQGTFSTIYPAANASYLGFAKSNISKDFRKSCPNRPDLSPAFRAIFQ